MAPLPLTCKIIKTQVLVTDSRQETGNGTWEPLLSPQCQVANRGRKEYIDPDPTSPWGKLAQRREISCLRSHSEKKRGEGVITESIIYSSFPLFTLAFLIFSLHSIASYHADSAENLKIFFWAGAETAPVLMIT